MATPYTHTFLGELQAPRRVLLVLLLLALTRGLNGAQPESSGAHNSVESLFGQVAKTVVYGGASFARFNSRLLCPLLSRETEKDNQDQPTLFVFNNKQSREHAFRIYADDDITQSLIEEAQFDADQMTYIFVHGWLGGIHNELWLSGAKNAALGQVEEVDQAQVSNNANNSNSNSNSKDGSHMFRPNVIIVDWSEFAQGSLYSATRNSLKVSRRLARILEQLANVGGLKPELMHCLGHSIGTHICGQAARYAFPVQPRPAGTQWPSGNNTAIRPLQRRLGRITGLDPGGFCYELGVRNETSYLGLRPSDALLVDAYYSNRSPFGNKYQVAHYNVRLNNGFFQQPCSVWQNPQVATLYFRAAVRFSLGNIGHNDILTCDHYFATRFAHQNPAKIGCSYMAYACDSYRNFLRGRCGLCEKPTQCYAMDFEYQRGREANVSNARAQIAKHSSYLGQIQHFGSEALIGAVPYAKRLTYYMFVADNEPYCTNTFRVRLSLNADVLDVSAFRAEWLRLNLFGPNGQRLKLRDAYSGSLTDSIGLYGPWTDQTDSQLKEMFGVDEYTLTALFELTDGEKASESQVRQRFKTVPSIDKIQVDYDNQLSRRQDPLANPVETIQIDYLSSSDGRVRSDNSRTFSRKELKVLYKHLESTSSK